MIEAPAGHFCWVDLAATDEPRAAAFYERLFGWTAQKQAANGGWFTRLQLAGHDVGSLYQLSRSHLENGMPSHWTPYIRVEEVDDAARRAVSSGGKLIVPPFDVSNFARIALIQDCVGAHVGLWQPLKMDRKGNADG
jgi:predicted enzyme related to lactoylglutathione lyase